MMIMLLQTKETLFASPCLISIPIRSVNSTLSTEKSIDEVAQCRQWGANG